MLMFCLFAGLRWRMGNPIGFDGPTGQEQAQNDTQDQLFLFGQAVHAQEHNMGEGQKQSQMVDGATSPG